VLAVRQKYADDQGGYLAATLTCYAFFSVFPLLLLLVTGLAIATNLDVNFENALAKGTEPSALIAEMLGRATGVCGGRR